MNWRYTLAVAAVLLFAHPLPAIEMSQPSGLSAEVLTVTKETKQFVKPAGADRAKHGAQDHGAMSQGSHEVASSGGSPTGMTREEELAYSLFMHKASGFALLVLGALVLADRLTQWRHGSIRFGIGLVWLLFGAFLVIRSDPEGWPIGPAGFVESFSMPTSGEWIQHKLLSLIPLALGIGTLITPHVFQKAGWSYALGAVLALGGAGLLVHQHLDHQTMDLVNLQHRLMAVTALFIAASSVADGQAGLTWTIKPFLLPGGLILLGLQLALYIE